MLQNYKWVTITLSQLSFILAAIQADNSLNSSGKVKCKLLKESYSSRKISVLHTIGIISSCSMYSATWRNTHTWDQSDRTCTKLSVCGMKSQIEIAASITWKITQMVFLYVRQPLTSKKKTLHIIQSLHLLMVFFFKVGRCNDHLVNKNRSYEPLMTSRTFAFPINNHMHLSNTASISK